jgi:hypothetical protein
VAKILLPGDFATGRAMRVVKGIDLSRPRHEIVIIGLGLLVFWVGVALKIIL